MQPQRAKSQREADAAATYPSLRACSVQGQGMTMGNPEAMSTNQTGTNFFLLVSLLSSPRRARVCGHSGSLSAEKLLASWLLQSRGQGGPPARSPCFKAPCKHTVPVAAQWQRLRQKGRAPSSSHPHLRTQIMILSAIAATSQAQVAANNFQSKHWQDLCHYPIDRKNLG